MSRCLSQNYYDLLTIIVKLGNFKSQSLRPLHRHFEIAPIAESNVITIQQHSNVERAIIFQHDIECRLISVCNTAAIYAGKTRTL